MTPPSSPLVSAAELSEELAATAGAAGSIGGQLVLVDVRYWMGQPGRGRQAYLAGHLPGARFVDLDAELAGAPTGDGLRPGTHRGGRHRLPDADQLARTVSRLGIEADSRVVAYDQANALAAARLWWLLRDAGHQHVRVLDGGLDVWVAAGGAVEVAELPDAHGSWRPEPGGLPVVGADQVEPVLAAGAAVVDVRSAERFRGEAEPVDPVAGHIPGATNLPATELQTSDGHFLPADELRSRLAGLRPGDVLSCGSGLTASQVMLAAESVGLSGLRLYPGSWSDWISDPARPVAPGD